MYHKLTVKSIPTLLLIVTFVNKFQFLFLIKRSTKL
jgi:hypothetical protein